MFLLNCLKIKKQIIFCKNLNNIFHCQCQLIYFHKFILVTYIYFSQIKNINVFKLVRKSPKIEKKMIKIKTEQTKINTKFSIENFVKSNTNIKINKCIRKNKISGKNHSYF